MSEPAAAKLSLGKLLPGLVVARLNRFVVEVEIADGSSRIVRAHLADPGRLEELVFPGNTVMVRRATGARNTTHDLVLARFVPEQAGSPKPIWVSVDTRLPNRLFEAAVGRGTLGEFKGVTGVRREVHSPGDQASRFDFLLTTGRGPVLVEVKSVTLCRNGTGLFPDAPTRRGARHARELARVAGLGLAASVVFIAQREDVRMVLPNRSLDPGFAAALEEAVKAGVMVVAYRCRVTPDAITLLQEPVPVSL